LSLERDFYEVIAREHSTLVLLKPLNKHVVIEHQVGELSRCHIAALALYSHLACPRQDMDHVWLKSELLNSIHHTCTVVLRIKGQNATVPKERYLS